MRLCQRRNCWFLGFGFPFFENGEVIPDEAEKDLLYNDPANTIPEDVLEHEYAI